MQWDLQSKELTLGAGNGGTLQSRPLFAQKPRKHLSPPARLTSKQSPSPGCPQKPLQNLSPPHPSQEPLRSLSGPECPAIAASFSSLLPVPPATRSLQRSNLQGLPTGAGVARTLCSERQGRQGHSSSRAPAVHQALSWGGNRNRASWVPECRGSPSGGLQPAPSLIWICSHEFSQEAEGLCPGPPTETLSGALALRGPGGDPSWERPASLPPFPDARVMGPGQVGPRPCRGCINPSGGRGGSWGQPLGLGCSTGEHPPRGGAVPPCRPCQLPDKGRHISERGSGQPAQGSPGSGPPSGGTAGEAQERCFRDPLSATGGSAKSV